MQEWIKDGVILSCSHTDKEEWIDVLGNLSPSSTRISAFGLAMVTIRRSKARDIRYGLNIPYEYVPHVMAS